MSWWGRESEEAPSLTALFRGAGEAGLILAPYYETGELWRRGAAGVAADLVSLLDRHGHEPAWLRVGGVPVVFLYASHRLRPRAWDAVRARLDREGRRSSWSRTCRAPSGSPRARTGSSASTPSTSTPRSCSSPGAGTCGAYRALADLARAAGRPFVPAVAPGFDDRQVRTPGTVVDRAGGATYDRSWEAALAVDPSWILVSSWNEWHEGSEIEPSLEHGRRYLDATRAWAERFRQRAP